MVQDEYEPARSKRSVVSHTAVHALGADPVGMKLYQAHHVTEMAALSVVFWLIHEIRRKTKRSAKDAGWSGFECGRWGLRR